MEERILIEYYRPIKELNDGSEDRIMNKLTRAEAIERMAKAICANEDEYTDCEQCEFNGPEDCKRYYINNWLYTAEAALNALLGE